MGLTSTLNTAQNGLQLNETAIDVIGNNVANAETNGFKASRVLFASQLARTLNPGSAPSGNSGGANPQQIGLGAQVAAIQPNFGQGTLITSGVPTDLAIQGNGFFVLDSGQGRTYTRNGNFQLNPDSLLTNQQGFFVMGYGINEQFEVDETGGIQPISIPIGTLRDAEATTEVIISGSLASSESAATQGSINTSLALVDGTNTPITNAALATTALTDVRLQSDPATPLFALNDVISLNAKKGERQLDEQTLTVGAGTTMQDFLDFFNGSLGIQETDVAGNPLPGTPGVTMDGGGSGQIVVRGNFGTANSVELPMGSISVNQSSSPLTFSQTQVADGDSAVLPFVVYDSLGKPINVRMTAYVETITPTSTTFRYLLESNADSDLDIAVGNSTITFDSDGRVTSTPDNAFAIDRDDSAADQLLFDMQFDELFNLDGNESVLQLEFQNGTPPGTLTDYVIDEQGLINGIFDNGLVRSLGQLVMSRFDNPNGLIQSGPGTFTEGVNSGLARIGTPGSVNMGTVRAGAVELSNTDIGQSMVDLIRSSTNYRGNARVISSVQNLIDELLLLGR